MSNNNSIIDLLSGEQFRFFILPICTVLLTLFIKIACKKDTDRLFSWADCAVGPNLITTSILILLSKASIIAMVIKNEQGKQGAGSERLIALMMVLIILFLGLIALILIIKRCGWSKDLDTGRPYLKKWWGVVFPDLIGVAYLIIVFTFNIRL